MEDFFNNFLNLGSLDSCITGKVSNPILNAELIVLPPMFKAATPVGATTIFRRLASGIDGGPALDLVLINAALGLMVADKAGDPKSAADLALDAIRSGRVNSLLEKIIVLSNQ